MMREIILDTETTGFDPEAGDRIVEIGCVEMVNQSLTGQVFHAYIDPERAMPQGAFEVHGLSTEFLRGKPKFSDIQGDLKKFIGDDSMLVAHNASFDIKFINAEFARLEQPPYDPMRVVDTLLLARRKHPMGPNSLDALCARYGIDNSRREKHGALLDAELLAEVYIELLGGRQRGFDLGQLNQEAVPTRSAARHLAKQRPIPLAGRLDEAAISAHRKFVDTLGNNTLWHRIWQKNQ